MAATLCVIAHIKSLPNRAEALKALLQELVEPTRSEAGCLSYQLLQNHTDPTEFAFIEEWASEAAEAAHLDSAHVAQAFAESIDLLVAPPGIRRYVLIA